MIPDEAVVAVIDALDHAAIPFMIVGSLAPNFHGIPRATRDADFLIQVGSASISDLAAALPDDLRLEPQAAFEAVTGTTRYLVTLQQSPFVCESFLCGDDQHDHARFERRERVRVLSREAFMAVPRGQAGEPQSAGGGAGASRHQARPHPSVRTATSPR